MNGNPMATFGRQTATASCIESNKERGGGSRLPQRPSRAVHQRTPNLSTCTLSVHLGDTEQLFVDELHRLLTAIEEGEQIDSARLVESAYHELHRLAQSLMMREAPENTLQATALVHEVFLRMGKRAFKPSGDDTDPTESSDVSQTQLSRSRNDFFAAAAEAMRRILIDNARRKKRQKRGGDRSRVQLRPDELMINAVPDDLLDLDVALQRLEELDETKANVVKMRYFTGLTVEETANVLDISTATVKRYWVYSKAWLRREIDKESA